ncbi:MAG TPA: hypothetical protein VGF44_09180 [Terriglobales bacterium]|jgi:hypothetical protein
MNTGKRTVMDWIKKITPKILTATVMILVFLAHHSGVGGGLIFGRRSRKDVIQAL